jgi:AraC-like DNA-binding protein
MNTFKVSSALQAGLKAIGIDLAVLLRKSGLPLTLWTTGQGMVTTEQHFRLWRTVRELHEDPAIGLKLPGLIPVDQHHPAIIAAYHARTFRDALQRFARYKILCCYEEMIFRETMGECSLEFNWVQSREVPPPLLLDVAFMASVEMGRRGAQKPSLHPLRLELGRSAEHREIYEAAFGCPVKFKAKRDAIIFRSCDLDLPFVSYNAELLEMLTPQLDQQLAQRKNQQSCSDQVKWVLKRLLGGHRPEITEVAKELGMSGRTMQRRITDEGTSFRQLLNDARRELAQFYLKEPSLSVSEIAYLLSYEDPSSFFRAFHEWEGTTPSEWKTAFRPQATKRGVSA